MKIKKHRLDAGRGKFCSRACKASYFSDPEKERVLSVPFVDEETRMRGIERGIDLEKGSLRTVNGRFFLTVSMDLYPGIHNTSNSALRSRVVWWIFTGDILVGCKFNIHHKNRNRSDDSFSNLEKIGHSEHTRLHHPIGAADVEKKCRQCGSTFTIQRHRLKEIGRGSFCNRICYKQYKNRPEVKAEHSEKIKAWNRKRISA